MKITLRMILAAGLSLAVVAGCSSPGGSGTDSSAPGNPPAAPANPAEGTSTSPVALSVGAVHNGSLGPRLGSSSYYCFTTGAAGPYYIQGCSAGPQEVYPSYFLYKSSDYSGSNLASGYDQNSRFVSSLDASTTYYLEVANVFDVAGTFSLVVHDSVSSHDGSSSASAALTVGGNPVLGVVGVASSSSDWCSWYCATPTQGGFGELKFSLDGMIPESSSKITNASAYSHQDKPNMGDPGYIGTIANPLNGHSGIAFAARSGTTYYIRSLGGAYIPALPCRYAIQATYSSVTVQALPLGTIFKPTFQDLTAWLKISITAGKSYRVNLKDSLTDSGLYCKSVQLTAYQGDQTQTWGSLEHTPTYSIFSPGVPDFPVTLAAGSYSGTVYLGLEIISGDTHVPDFCALEVDEQ
jgi:hypothetical protein